MSDPLTDRELMAKEYDAIHNRLFLLQILVLGMLLGIYQFSGASAALANGLASRFGENMWWATNAVYTLVSVFGFAAFMSPFGFYSSYVLEHHYGLSDETVGDWVFDFIKSLVIDLVIATVLVSVIYAFLRWIPELWWVSASAFYILFAIVLSSVLPTVILPLFQRFEPLEEGALSDEVHKMMNAAGIEISGVFKWEGDERPAATPSIIGVGRQKRVLMGEAFLGSLTRDEILALLAHEVGHFRNRDTLRLVVTSSILAVLGFYVAHHCLLWLTGFFDIPHIYEIGAAPIFIFSLFVFSLVSMPFANAHSRRREFAADAYAIQQMGSPDALVSAFEKLADQNLADKEPAKWVEFLLHSHPSIGRRIKRAQED